MVVFIEYEGEAVTSKEKREEIQITEKQPKKESAIKAAMSGSILVQPFMTLKICVASMLGTWNFSIKYTTKLVIHPATASVKPTSAPASFNAETKLVRYSIPQYLEISLMLCLREIY